MINLHQAYSVSAARSESITSSRGWVGEEAQEDLRTGPTKELWRTPTEAGDIEFVVRMYWDTSCCVQPDQLSVVTGTKFGK